MGWLKGKKRKFLIFPKRSGVGDGRSKAPRAFFMKNLLYHRNLKNVKIFNKLNSTLNVQRSTLNVKL